MQVLFSSFSVIHRRVSEERRTTNSFISADFPRPTDGLLFIWTNMSRRVASTYPSMDRYRSIIDGVGVLFHTSSPRILVSIEVLHLCISITLYSIMADTKGTFLVEESQSQLSCLIAAAEPSSFDADPREIVWGNLLL